MGLGLTIARDLVKAFGGTIEIHKPFEIGTDFVINLKAKSKITRLEYSNYFHSHVNFSNGMREDPLSPLVKLGTGYQGDDSSSSSICMS